MIKEILIGNNIEKFYTEFTNIMQQMFPTTSTIITRIDSNIGRVTVRNNLTDIIYFYVANPFPTTTNNALKQLVICNRQPTIVNNEISFTNFESNGIGPILYSSLVGQTYSIPNDYWITNTNVNNIADFSLLTDEQKMCMSCSIDSLCLASNNYDENEYIWLGFKAKQEITPLLFITKTNNGNISMFGVTDMYVYTPTTVYGDYVKAATTVMTARPVLYKPTDLCIDSTTICLSNVIIPQSANHEYLPYLYYCTGKDSSAKRYVQLVSDGVEYYKILNDNIVVVSNPKFTIYQKIIYTINIDNTYYYELDGTIKLIDNSNEVTVNWGDGTTPETIPDNTSNLNLSHTYNNGGYYNITVSYRSLANPTNLGNVIYIDKYTTDVDFSRARDLYRLNVVNIFKEFDVEHNGYNTRLKSVTLPPNCQQLTATGFCENCENLSNIIFPTTNERCIISGDWLYDSSFGVTNIADTFEYPDNLNFQMFTKFYTGNFGKTIIINSVLSGDTIYVNNKVEHLIFASGSEGAWILVDTIEPDDLTQLSTNSLTSITFRTGFDGTLPTIKDFPNLTTITYEGNPLSSSTAYLSNLSSLTTLVIDTVDNVSDITNCSSLTTINLSPNLNYVDSGVGNGCTNFYAFSMSSQGNSDYYVVDGVLYRETNNTKYLVKVPYGYLTHYSSYSIPSDVNVIEYEALSINGTLDNITISSNVTEIYSDCFASSSITTLRIDADVLSDIEFTEFTVTNLIFTENVTALDTSTFSNVHITSLTIYDTDIVLTTNQFDMNSLQLIKGYVGSTAETFANDNNIDFVPIDFGTNKSKYYITIPTNNYTVSNVCNLSSSYSLIDWGDGSEPETLYNLETNLTHTYEVADDYVVTITHIAPSTIDYSYTSINQGLFALATKLDFSEITLGNASITNAFNNLITLEEIDYPSNLTAINGTLVGSNNVTTIVLPNALTTLQNSFNEDYDDIISFTIPTTLTTITNCFNNTNIIPTTLSINTINVSGLDITTSFNDNATTSLTLGDKVNSIFNSFNNCLSLATLTCDSNNTSLLAENNMLYNKAKTTLILVPGGLNTFTIPSTTTTTVSQSSIANSKTYSAISIPENISTVTFPCYTPRDESQSTNITTLTINNPYTSISSINKTIQVSLQGNVDTSTITSIPTYDPSHTYTDGEYMMYNGTIYIADSINGSNIVVGDNLFVTYASRIKDSTYDYMDNGYFESYGNYSWVHDEDFYSTGSIPLITGKNYKFVTPAWYCSNNRYYALAVFVNTAGSWGNSNYIDNHKYGYAGEALTWNQSAPSAYVHMTIYKPNESSYGIYELSTQKFSIATYYYNDTANITNITAYEHSVANSQIDGYERYPNCSSYNFNSLGYYNSSIVIGSNYTDNTFTNSQLLTISDNLITEYNSRFGYIVPDETIYSHLSELITYVCANGYDFATAGYPYVIFYYNDTVNNIYDYIIYVFENSAANTSINIDNSNYTYSTMYFTVQYDVANQVYTNLVSNSTFTARELVTLNPNVHAVLTNYKITSVIDSNDTNITPTFLQYTTLFKVNTSDFTGYIIGSNKTGTNKLFLSGTGRVDDYWLDVSANEIDADNIVNVASFSVDTSGNIISGSGQTLNNISEDVTYLKLIRTDKYMFENNVELVSPIYELPTT